MKTPGKLAVISLSVLILAGACSKNDKEKNTDNEESAAKLTTANVTAESMFEDASNEVLITSQENVLLRSTPSAKEGETVTTYGTNGVNGCASVTINPIGASFPKTVTIDYGDAGCAGTLGITRKGKIIYTITGKFSTPGSLISVSFQNYKVNGYGLEGTYSITNTTVGLAPSITTLVTAGKLTYPDASFYAYAGTKTLVQTAGVLTPLNLLDNELSITGTNSITSSDGRSLTATTKTPLLKKFTCRNIVSGTVDFTYNGISGVWSYGAGECDNVATIQVGNWTGTINLP